MGNYVYAIRRQSIKATLPSGEDVRLWFLKYVYKPSYSRRSFNAPYQALLARLENAWLRAAEKPDYVVSIDSDDGKPQENSHVMKWTSSAFAYNDGSNRSPGEHVGYLKREGRRWVVLAGYPPRPEPVHVERPEPTIGNGIAPVPC